MEIVNNDKNALLLREWLALAFFAAFFLAVIFFSLIENWDKSAQVRNIFDGEIKIYIDGEVDNPGMFSVKEGTTLLQALNQAGLKNSSNIEKIDLNRVVLDGERLKIRARKMVKIRLIYPGALEEELEVPHGTKKTDIEERFKGNGYQIQFENKRRTLLRDGDKVMLINGNYALKHPLNYEMLEILKKNSFSLVLNLNLC